MGAFAAMRRFLAHYKHTNMIDVEQINMQQFDTELTHPSAPIIHLLCVHMIEAEHDSTECNVISRITRTHI